MTSYKKHSYIVDTKLVAYYLYQRGSQIHGILDKIAQLLFEHAKGDIYFAFDVGKSSYRLDIHPMYKGHRASANSKMTTEDQRKLEIFNADYIRLIELSKLLPVRVLAVHGVEADDLVSILCHRLQKDPEQHVHLVTADMDYVNSVVGTDNVDIIDVFKNVVVNNTTVLTKYKLSTRKQFNVHKAILGDKSDNIKFLKGVGDVKASEIFESIYDRYTDPSTDEIVGVIENYVKQRPKIKIHEYHIEQGRCTIKDAFEANMLIVDTFTDTSKMTPFQEEEFNKALTYEIPKSINSLEFIKQSIDIIGYPLMVGHKAGRVFKIYD